MKSATALALPPPLFEGDRMDAAEFLRRWEALPDVRYAELIDGVVFMPSPVSFLHGRYQFVATRWLAAYEERTPGSEGASDCTWLMGDQDVPQPDVFLRIKPALGGQSRGGTKYAEGAPELIVEISGSSRSRDFGAKQALYLKMGVREYLTVQWQKRILIWRRSEAGRFVEIRPGKDGLLRSRIFPGLWLDPAAFWEGNVAAAVHLGLESPEHAAFVKRLAKTQTLPKR